MKIDKSKNGTPGKWQRTNLKKKISGKQELNKDNHETKKKTKRDSYGNEHLKKKVVKEKLRKTILKKEKLEMIYLNKETGKGQLRKGRI